MGGPHRRVRLCRVVLVVAPQLLQLPRALLPGLGVVHAASAAAHHDPVGAVCARLEEAVGQLLEVELLGLLPHRSHLRCELPRRPRASGLLLVGLPLELLELALLLFGGATFPFLALHLLGPGLVDRIDRLRGLAHRTLGALRQRGRRLPLLELPRESTTLFGDPSRPLPFVPRPGEHATGVVSELLDLLAIRVAGDELREQHLADLVGLEPFPDHLRLVGGEGGALHLHLSDFDHPLARRRARVLLELLADLGHEAVEVVEGCGHRRLRVAWGVEAPHDEVTRPKVGHVGKRLMVLPFKSCSWFPPKQGRKGIKKQPFRQGFTGDKLGGL